MIYRFHADFSIGRVMNNQNPNTNNPGIRPPASTEIMILAFQNDFILFMTISVCGRYMYCWPIQTTNHRVIQISATFKRNVKVITQLV